jgi:hypothetical protein
VHHPEAKTSEHADAVLYPEEFLAGIAAVNLDDDSEAPFRK